MTMNPDGVIEGFNVFKDKPVCMAIVSDVEPVQPFSFNQGMEGFNTSIIVRITAMRIVKCYTNVVTVVANKI